MTNLIFDVHTELIQACKKGDLDSFMRLLYNNGPTFQQLVHGDLTHPYKSKYGPYMPGDYLYIACLHGHAEIARELLRNGAEESKPFNKVTPLTITCVNGHAEVLRVLITDGVGIISKDCEFKDSAIFICARYGHKDAVEVIVKELPTILQEKTKGSIGTCPAKEFIHQWTELGSIIKKEGGVPIGNALMYITCILQHMEVMKFLVDKGVDVNATLSKKTFYTSLERPISAVCRNDNYEMAKFLMSSKAEITESVANQYPELVGKLLESHIKPYRRTYSVDVVMNPEVREIQENSVVLYWDNLNLRSLHRHWIKMHGEKVCKIDIHDNSIAELPVDFFELLPNLEDLDMSCNKLNKLPSHGIVQSKVKRIIICHNSLTTLPLELFLNKNIVSLDVTQNKLTVLPGFTENTEHSTGTVNPTEVFWQCTSLQSLKCSNNELSELPREIQGAVRLEKLQLDHNNLTDFNIIWKCPLMELDVSNNQLQYFTGMAQIVWSKTLRRLNLSRNCIKTISSSISYLQSLEYLDMSKNCLKTLPPPGNWKCKMLSKLNLSHNLLTATYVDDIDATSENRQSCSSTCEFPVELFEYTLHYLDLSYNKLESVPESICLLSSLSELDLGRNPSLRSLPRTLGNLKNIWSLRLAGLNLSNIPFELNETNKAKEVLPYLREKLRKSEPFNRMKLMVVGLQGIGKTTLVAAIQGKSQLPLNISTVGISIEQFVLPLKSFRLFSSPTSSKSEITFSTWDLAGQQVYYATHQCFLTSQTLYLVVFNVTLGVEGINSLASWLLNIQARAPNSRCIVVGTHIDQIQSDMKRSHILNLEKKIRAKYAKKGFPDISGYIFVSSTTGENMELLRTKIYGVAEHMNGSNSKFQGRTAPLSYIQLYDSIIKESARRKSNNVPPILTTDNMLALAKSNENNDIYDVEELIQATKFLHEYGTVLHFDDHLRGLNTLFFIDPAWLCDMLSLVVTVRERNPYVRDGYITKQDLMLLLKNPRLPEEFIQQYLRLLERFEIVLCLDDERFLIPSMLPQDRPDVSGMLAPMLKIINDGNSNSDTDTRSVFEFLTRNYHMSYIPAGFWSRLIARLMIAFHKWGKLVQEEDCDAPTDNYSFKLWREGILVSYSDGFILVEGFKDDYECEELGNQGVSIMVWSKERDFSDMGFIVDHLDMLIMEWYPGLEDVDEYGINLIQKLIPCPICSVRLQKSVDNDQTDFEKLTSFFRNPDEVQQFHLLTCALAATSYQSIRCPKHPDEHVTLDLVVPDLRLTDLPSNFVIDGEQFVFAPSDATRLGEGGAGGVYLGQYKGLKVAVKQFHSTTKAKQFDETDNVDADITDSGIGNSRVFTPSVQSIQEQIEDGKVIRAFWELRQEVAVLCRLQHPNIIRFIGVCNSPLCFVIELAPLGSLQGIVEKLQMERDTNNNGTFENSSLAGAILGRTVTHKIAAQVMQAIAYLHECEIVYRDLKSDNVLVWSLDEQDKVNVKISDYGIAAFATPQGVVGEGGTPGFQAPEIKYGSPYDEKVDLFSYGIWLYEMMSGYRPFREYRTASEMKKAIIRGIRPSLRKDNINSNLPYLEIMMENCWQQNATARPTSKQVCAALSLPGTCILENIFPRPDESTLQKVTCAVKWLEKQQEEIEDSRLLVWCDHDVDRKFQVFDFCSETFTMEGLIPGPRVLCACHVENYIWLGNESRQIEVFGQLDLRKPQVLWTFVLLDHVLSMITFEQKEVLTVYCALANGSMAVFKKKLSANDQKPIFADTIDDLISFEKDHWEKTIIQLNTKGFPAKCMTVTRNQTELWIGSGNTIVILDLETDTIVEHLEATKSTNRQAHVITSDGQKYVWNCERGVSLIAQWDVETRQKICEYQCNVDRPLNQILYSEPGSRHRSSETFPPFEQYRVNDDNVFRDESERNERNNVPDVLPEPANVLPKPAETLPEPANVLPKPADALPEPADILPEREQFRARTKSIQKDTHKMPSILSRTKSAATEVKLIFQRKKSTDQDIKPRSKSDESELPDMSPKKTSTMPVSIIDQKAGLSNIIEGIEATSCGFVEKSLRKKPSLMFPMQSVKRKSRREKDYVPEELLHNSLTRPRSSVVSEMPIRVTSLKYVQGALWVGRTSGDIIVMNVDANGDLPRGKVITVLGNSKIRPLGGYNRTVNSLIDYTSNSLLALVRFDMKASSKSPKSLPRQNTLTIGETFQLMKFQTWKPKKILDFLDANKIDE